MITPRLLPILCAGLMTATLAASAATAQQTPPDREDTALAFAQCMRDNGFTEFEDPTPDGDLRIRVTPESAPRFRAASEACRDLAPEGFRDGEMSPEQLEALVKLSQCVRENGIPDFPDPGPQGNYDLSSLGIGPGDQRLEAAMDVCRDETGFQQGFRITVGG